MKGPLAKRGIEGPSYADRVGGRLTFRDWEHWTHEDRDEYREQFEMRLMAGHPPIDCPALTES